MSGFSLSSLGSQQKYIFQPSLKLALAMSVMHVFCPMQHMRKWQPPLAGLACPSVPLDLVSVVDSYLNRSLLGWLQSDGLPTPAVLPSLQSVLGICVSIYYQYELISALDYFGVQIVPDLVSESQFNTDTVPFLCVLTSLFSDVRKYSRLISHRPCPSPGICSFSEEC